ISGTAVQAQYYPQDRDRDYRRDRDDDRNRRNDDWRRRNGGYGNNSQVAYQQGYQDGIYTGQNDGSRGQSYNPQRSHYFEEAGFGNFGEVYRSGFVKGYAAAFRV
ncbi:MAG TPA: hypothetical protein VFD75_17665, partial [Pyrinomonadaceae bacterium]|nr:hypothetical protein [Pyrinomonadaceae bacterium]